MKKLKQIAIVAVLIIIVGLGINQYVSADSGEINVYDFFTMKKFSKEFEKWAELSEEEKENSIQPRMYNDLYTKVVVSNPLYQVNLLGASLSSSYDLRTIIPNNLAIRNQSTTSYCWAFSGLSSLETNLALNNYNNKVNLDRVYDYSERHVNYATTRLFRSGAVNDLGFNRSPSSGGQWYLVENYLTSGQGAISESQMPFSEDTSIIDIGEIQNKTIASTVYDTVYFSDYSKLTGSDRTNAMNEIKQHIKENGAVFASIHGDTTDSINLSCYNNDTGAKYCNNSLTHPKDHAVSIIGWDDDYAIDNFSENARPTSNGAWIARNSWGEEISYDLAQFKAELFSMHEQQFVSNGINSAEEIPDEFIVEVTGYQISDGKLIVPIGDNGFMYISYEDCNVGGTMYGIKKASDQKDYAYIYQYDELYPAVEITLNTASTYICNIFDKQSEEDEFLTGVALTTPETYTCKVYVNPNGTGKTRDDMQLVELDAGDSETFGAGYHTIEFAEPLKINSNQFAVVVEVTGTRNAIDIVAEGVIEEADQFNYVKTETGKCLVSSEANFDTCTWFDLGTIGNQAMGLVNCDNPLKAFTITETLENSLESLEIVTPPTKTEYKEGENFDKEGMKVRAIYSDETFVYLEDSDYSITNGTNLKKDQTSVTITYMGKSVEQAITVTADSEKPEPEPEQPEETAKNSDFSNAKCTLADIRAFYYEDSSYTLINTEISGIERNLNNDTYEYYYYLSSKGNLTNISDWVKISSKQTNNTKLKFDVDSRSLKNYDEVSKASTLYIYIKETVTKGGNQSVVVSKAIKYEIGDASIETYVNGGKTGTYNAPNSSSTTNSGTPGGTTNQPTASNGQVVEQAQTTSSSSASKLPYTGSSLIIIGIIILILVGIVVFIRYEILNRYVK